MEGPSRLDLELWSSLTVRYARHTIRGQKDSATCRLRNDEGVSGGGGFLYIRWTRHKSVSVT